MHSLVYSCIFIILIHDLQDLGCVFCGADIFFFSQDIPVCAIIFREGFGDWLSLPQGQVTPSSSGIASPDSVRHFEWKWLHFYSCLCLESTPRGASIETEFRFVAAENHRSLNLRSIITHFCGIISYSNVVEPALTKWTFDRGVDKKGRFIRFITLPKWKKKFLNCRFKDFFFLKNKIKNKLLFNLKTVSFKSAPFYLKNCTKTFIY